MQYILVTGSNGMVGKYVVNTLLNSGFYVLGVSIENESPITHKNYIYKMLNLTKSIEVEELFREFSISHVIHLVAIAHTQKGMDASWSQYYRINTLCSKTLFNCATANNIPIFFASTIDVYGIKEKEVDEETQPTPISFYARSKWMAEKLLQEMCKNGSYMIARFAPIFTDNNKNDIQKRFFISYPKICYRLGKGKEYEFLSINKVLDIVLLWVKNPKEMKGIFNVRDESRYNTKDLIDAERANGNGKIVIIFPELMVKYLKFIVDVLFKNESVFKFKVYKIICPYRTNIRKLTSYIDK